MIAAMSASLISPAWRTRTGWVCAVALIGFALLAGLVADTHSTGFDDWLFRELYRHTGDGFARASLGLSEPVVSIAICGLVVVAAAIARRWDIAALAVAGPVGTVLLTEYVCKPLIGRVLATGDIFAALQVRVPNFDEYSYTGVFPSGHQSAVAATACVLVIVCCQPTVSRRLRAVLLGLIGVWTLIAAVGLVRNLWHYATDTLGAMLLAVTVVSAAALALDRYLAPAQIRLAARLGAERQLTRRS